MCTHSLAPALGLAAALLLGTRAPALGQSAGERPVPPPPAVPTTMVVESCVSQDLLRFSADDPWAMLETADRSVAWSQMVRRHPALQQVGVAPSQILLWRKPGSGWLYVNLLAHPARPLEWCFTASVVAAPLEATPQLLRKYFALRSA